MARNKRRGKVNINLKEIYEEVFKTVEREVVINIYAEVGTLDNVIVKKDDIEIVNLSGFDYDAMEMFREIKKQFIKNNLYPIKITEVDNNLVINTTTNLLKLLYVSQGEEKYDLEELEKIKQEIELENYQIG